MALAPAQFSIPMHRVGDTTTPFNHHHSFHHLHHHLPSSITQTPQAPESQQKQHAAASTVQVRSNSSSNGGRLQRRVTLVHKKPVPVSPSLPVTEVAVVARQKKTVRFCDTLEQVRLFLKTQRPSAVGEGDPLSIPLEAKFPNWPEKTVLQSNRDSMVRMESVQLESSGSDDIVITGRCKVANVAFDKHVVVRYTTDYWKTYHEIVALYREPIGASANTWDRFTFEITLDQPCTLYIVLRYNINDNEFWDNNGGLNYQVDIVETSPIEPIGRPRNPVAPTTPEFKDEADNKNEKVESFSTRDPQDALAPQPQPQQRPRPNPAFSSGSVNSMFTSSSSQRNKKLGSRYDFGASLSAAKKYEPSYPFLMLSSAMGGSSSASPTASDEDIQARYHDLVSKYCFYGNPTTTSAEPICG